MPRDLLRVRSAPCSAAAQALAVLHGQVPARGGKVVSAGGAMSLVGFKAENHPQQVQDNGAKDDVDDRWTPDWLFRELDTIHRFTIDVAASKDNAKCARYIDIAANGLAQSWSGERVWCNPPYSALPAWIEYAYRQVFDGGCERVVLLLPANRTEQPWWHQWIEPYRDRGQGVSVRFIEKRFNFARPTDPDGKYNSSPPFGCCVVVFMRPLLPVLVRP